LSATGQLVVSRRLLKLEYRATRAYMQRDLHRLTLVVAKLRRWKPRFYEDPVSEFIGAKIVLARVLSSRDLPGDLEEATKVAVATEQMLRQRPFPVATAGVQEMIAQLLRQQYEAGGAVHLIDQAISFGALCLVATDAADEVQYAERVRLLSGLLVTLYQARRTPDDYEQAVRFCARYPGICDEDRERLGAPPG
jgi:hypothetical protein